MARRTRKRKRRSETGGRGGQVCPGDCKDGVGRDIDVLCSVYNGIEPGKFFPSEKKKYTNGIFIFILEERAVRRMSFCEKCRRDTCGPHWNKICSVL